MYAKAEMLKLEEKKQSLHSKTTMNYFSALRKRESRLGDSMRGASRPDLFWDDYDWSQKMGRLTTLTSVTDLESMY